MSLDPNELSMIIEMKEGIARIDERTQNMVDEMDDKFVVVHKRIDATRKNIKEEGSKAGLKAGASIAGIIGAGVAALGAYFSG